MSSYAELAGELSETRRCHQTGVACSTGGDPGSWNAFEVCACVYFVCSYAALFRGFVSCVYLVLLMDRRLTQKCNMFVLLNGSLILQMRRNTLALSKRVLQQSRLHSRQEMTADPP